ncbi:MAG: DUF4149 domain-containing protein [Planctomycetota bacterium]
MAALFASIVFLATLSVWLGGVVFFSFFTAPVIFERLPRNQAADLIQVIFPRYYRMGYVCGFAMLVSGCYFLVSSHRPGLVWTSWLLALAATSVSLYAGMVVMPRVRRLRLTAASSAGSPEHSVNRALYEKAHHLSVFLNTVVLLLLVVVVVLFGYQADFFSAD